MKKVLAVLLLAVLSASLLTGCKSNADVVGEAIVGKWVCVEYREYVDNNLVDSNSGKSTSDVHFYDDGTMKFAKTGAVLEWSVSEEKTDGFYLINVGDEYKFNMPTDDTTLLYKINDGFDNNDVYCAQIWLYMKD